MESLGLRRIFAPARSNSSMERMSRVVSPEVTISPRAGALIIEFCRVSGEVVSSLCLDK